MANLIHAQSIQISARGIKEQIKRRELAREAEWTESLAIGDRVFVEAAARRFERRSEFSYSELTDDGDKAAWSVREVGEPYSPISTPESVSKPSTQASPEDN